MFDWGWRLTGRTGWAASLLASGMIAGCIAPGGGLDKGGVFDTVPEDVYEAPGQMLSFAYCLQDFIVKEDCNMSVQDALIVPAADGKSVTVMCDFSRYFGGGGSMGMAVGSGQGAMGMAAGGVMGALAGAAVAPGEGQFAPLYTLAVRQTDKDQLEIRNWTTNQAFLVDKRLAMMKSAVETCSGGTAVAAPPPGSDAPAGQTTAN